MANKPRVNPRRIPVSQADINRARQDNITIAWAIIFSVLVDKEGFTPDDIARVWQETEDLADSLTKGYVNINDLQRTLEEEYKIQLGRRVRK